MTRSSTIEPVGTARGSGGGAATDEIERGERFGFGENWTRFIDGLTQQRIDLAEESLRASLEMQRLDGKTFLDIGSCSGLLSLAARRLGARVRSFDFDPKSAACTAELKRRFYPHDDE